MRSNQISGKPPVREQQMSDSLLLGTLMALAGGFMGAYTFTARGGVLAYGQTGNILRTGIHLSHLRLAEALCFFLPVFAFSLGVLLVEYLRHHSQNTRLHWRQKTVGIEILLLCLVAFLPEEVNLLANSIVSLVCGIQVESFRRVEGNAFASTMTTGNLRSANEALYKFLTTRDPAQGRKCAVYFAIMGSFVLGAVVGSFASEALGIRAVLICCVLLIIPVVLMRRENTPIA